MNLLGMAMLFGLGGWFSSVLILCTCTLHLGSATLSLFHGRLSSSGITIEQVQGVVTLGLGGTPVSQFLDCNGTQNNVTNLEWRKDNVETRFAVQSRSTGIRLDLSTAQVSDEGIYECIDIVTRYSVSINISGANLAICPAEPVVNVVRGSTVLLRVYVSSLLSILASDIVWMDPKRQVITSSSRYTLVDSNTALRITSTGVEDNGTYKIVINKRIFGNSFLSVSTTINLNIQDPPTSSVIPQIITVSEGENVQFNCTAGGTLTTQRWTRNGAVLTSTEQLVLSSVTTDDAGSYVCEVFGQFGKIARSTATLNVYSFVSVEVRDSATMASSNQTLNITRQDGDPGIIFSCHSEGFPVPTIRWSRAGGLPTGVTLRNLNSVQILEWNRNMLYTDSGVYICTSQNNHSANMAILNLLVENVPVLTSVFATSPVKTISTSSFSVPNGYSGNVLTCTGFGWPPPLIEWVAAGAISTLITSSTTTMRVPFVSAKLAVSQFRERNVGNYSCTVRPQSGSGRLHEETIMLILNSNPLPTDSLMPQCNINSVEVMFQLTVLDVNCKQFLDPNNPIVAKDTRNQLLSVIQTECTSCLAPSNNVSISVVASCSQIHQAAILFTGTIISSTIQSTELVFCTMNRWAQSRPLLQVNNALHQVSDGCILVNEDHDKTCSASTSSPTVILHTQLIILAAIILVLIRVA